MAIKTTDISNKDVAEPKSKPTQYSFPQHGITVEANSWEEALEKLNEQLNKQ
jgi:hypothetical protein